jgi:hypothetical protein
MRSDERQIRRLLGKFYRPWYRRVLPWLFALAFAVGLGRLALTPLADHWARQALGELTGFRAEYRDLEIFSFPPVVVLGGVSVESADNQRMLTVERVELHTTWKHALRAALFGDTPTVRVRISRPRATLAGDAPVFLAEEIRNWLERRPPVNVELASIEEGDILVGAVGSARTEAWMSKLNASIQAESYGHSLRGKAALLGSGDATFQMKLPAGDAEASSGELQVSYLSLADLYLFLDGTPPRDVNQGTLAVAARFKVDGSSVSGVVRTNTAGVRATDLPPSLIDRLRVRLSGAAPFITAERKPTREPMEFSFRGSVSPAGTSDWLTVLSLSRALFVEGVGGAVAALPSAPAADAGPAMPAGHPAVVAEHPAGALP